jgi:hypothetical protein
VASLPQNVNIIGELSACRRPSWTRLVTTAITSAPDAADDGVSLADAASPASRIMICLREDVWRRTARVTVTTRDAATNYTVTVNGTAIATTTGAFATNDAILVELKAKIAADATVGGAAATPIVTSYLVDSNGSTTVGTAGGGNAAVALIVIGLAQTDYSIAVSAGGTGVLACKADPLTATAYIYVTADGVANGATTNKPATTDWALIDDGSKSVTYRGLALNLNTGGWERLHVELGSIAGHASDGGSVTYTDTNSPQVFIGPASRETS